MGAPPRPEEVGASAFVAWYAVTVLFIGSILSFLDRQVIALMVEHIKADLGLNDFEIGLLQGPPFGIFYAMMSIPIAVLADRANRRNIVVVGVGFWSVATAACGLAGSFLHLFLARIGVGSGEACLSPCAYSMISDYFRRHQLPLAMSVFTMGNLSGVGLAMIIGGAVLTYAERLGDIELWGIGHVAPWQFTFLVIGLPGMLLALLMLTVREPGRRGVLRDQERTRIADFLAFVADNRRTFSSLFGSFTLLVMVAYGNFAWVPTFFIRHFGWTAAEAGSVYGTVVAVFGTGGALFGGWLASWLSGRGHLDAPYRATLLCSLPLVPLALLVYLVVPDGRSAALLYAPYQFFSAVPAGLAAAAMMTITPNEMRAKISSAYLFVSNFIGLSLGAASVGFITHDLFGDDARVGESLAIINVVGIPLAAVAIWFGMRTYRDGVARLSPQ